MHAKLIDLAEERGAREVCAQSYTRRIHVEANAVGAEKRRQGRRTQSKPRSAGGWAVAARS